MNRTLAVILAIVLIAIGGIGVWLVTRGESEEDRVLHSFGALKSAVETRDPQLLGRYLHEQYMGWGGDRISAIALFERAIDSYSDAKIEVREQKITVNEQGTEATLQFEWTYRATLSSEVRTVTREQMDRLPSNMMPWEPARAVFRKTDAGQWHLLGIDTRIPQYR